MSLMNDLWEQAKDFLGVRQRTYRLAFNTPSGKAVLVDLAKFCRGNESTWDADQRKSDVLIGRREVWLRIQHHLNLSVDELTQIYVKPEVQAFAPKVIEPTNDEG